jgi:uncharacterized protein YndB with AHSA1/START domain
MKNQLNFEIDINAPRPRVWDVMLEDQTYRQWTKAFDPTSYYEGSWEKGSKIKFLSTNGGGMFSEIAENIPHKFISIRHLGMIIDGVEDSTSEDAKKWVGAYENYTFTDTDKGTNLKVELGSDAIPEDIIEMFRDMWPKALLTLKEICEADKK